MNTQNIRFTNSYLGRINQQARLLLVGERKRQGNAQARMLGRAAAEIGLK